MRASHINNTAIKPKNAMSNAKIAVIRMHTLPPLYLLSITYPFRGFDKSLIDRATELLICRYSLKESFLKTLTVC
jgi:hypothetical protein